MEEISIWGGQYFYQSKVTVLNAPDGAKLLTGIVNLKSKSLHQQPKSGYIATYDVQSENNDNMGMAIIYDPKNGIVGEAPKAASDVMNTYYVALPITNKNDVYFRFYACWEKSDERFTTKEGFLDYIKTQEASYQSPIMIQ